jgi:hypothetical protein
VGGRTQLLRSPRSTPAAIVGAHPLFGYELVAAGAGPSASFGRLGIGPVAFGPVPDRARTPPGHTPPALAHHRRPGRPSVALAAPRRASPRLAPSSPGWPSPWRSARSPVGPIGPLATGGAGAAPGRAALRPLVSPSGRPAVRGRRPVATRSTVAARRPGLSPATFAGRSAGPPSLAGPFRGVPTACRAPRRPATGPRSRRTGGSFRGSSLTRSSSTGARSTRRGTCCHDRTVY